MSQPYFESANVNDILEACQRTTIYNKVFKNAKHQTWKQQSWELYYKNDELGNPTAFRVEVDSTMPSGYAAATWPSSVAAEDNPFGIECAQGDPVFPVNLKALVVQVSDLDGWFEQTGIGI